MFSITFLFFPRLFCNTGFNGLFVSSPPGRFSVTPPRSSRIGDVKHIPPHQSTPTLAS